MSATKAQLKRLQQDAYSSVLRAVAASEMNWQKERLLTDLRVELDIQHDQHVALLDRVLQDDTITRVREATTAARAGSGALASRGPRGGGASAAPASKAKGGGGSKKRAASPSPAASAGGARGGGRAPPASRFAAGGGATPATAPRGARPARGGPLGTPGAPPASAPPALRGSGAAAAPGVLAGLNPLIGHKVWRHWPHEERQWAEGVITDYNPADDTHCIVYEFNTPNEAFEWFCLAAAVDGQDYRMSASPPINVLALAPPAGGAAAGGLTATPSRPASRLGGGGGGGRPAPRARDRDRRAGRPASGAPARAVADYAFERAVVPFDAAYLAAKLRTASLADLGTMAGMLAAREREVRAELAAVAALATPGGVPPHVELEAKLTLIVARETFVRAALKDLGKAVDAKEGAAAAAAADAGADAGAGDKEGDGQGAAPMVIV